METDLEELLDLFDQFLARAENDHVVVRFDHRIVMDDDYLAMRVTRADEQFWKLFLQENSLVEAIVFEGGARGRVSIVRVPESAQTDSQ